MNTIDTSNVKISDYELTARALFDQYFKREENWSQNKMLVCNVMKAMWSSSLPVEQIERVACAMFGFQTLDLQSTLTELCRAKVLRSRVINSLRHYEVNY